MPMQQETLVALLLPCLLLVFAPSQSLLPLTAEAAATHQHSHPHDLGQQQQHTNNWAVLVCTSRYWYNYRHFANTLAMYRTVKRLGIPDQNILLMLPDDVACNGRNPHPGRVYRSPDHALELYGRRVEIDYRGYDVTLENFVRLLTGRHDPAVPPSKRLLTDSGSNVLLYLSGHGGDGFLKFQGSEEMMAHDLSEAIAQMHEKGRYRELFLVVDTCQAASLLRPLTSPGVLAVASSKTGESSYSYLQDKDVGLSVIDRFTYYLLDFLEAKLKAPSSGATAAQMLQYIRSQKVGSTVVSRSDLFGRPLGSTRVADFFASVPQARPLGPGEVYPLLSPLQGGPCGGELENSALLQQQVGEQQQVGDRYQQQVEGEQQRQLGQAAPASEHGGGGTASRAAEGGDDAGRAKGAQGRCAGGGDWAQAAAGHHVAGAAPLGGLAPLMQTGWEYHPWQPGSAKRQQQQQQPGRAAAGLRAWLALTARLWFPGMYT